VPEHHINIGLRGGHSTFTVEGRLAFGIEQVAPHAPQVVEPDHQILATGLAVVHGDARKVGLALDLASDVDHLVPGFGRLQIQPGEHILAVKEQLHMAADREPHDVAAVAVLVARRAQVRIRVAGLDIDFLFCESRIEGIKQAVERGPPDVHRAQYIVLIRLGHQLGGELFTHAGKRHILVADLDAGQRFKLGELCLVGAELGCDDRQDVHGAASEGLAGPQRRGGRLGQCRCRQQSASGGELDEIASFHGGLLLDLFRLLACGSVAEGSAT